MALICQIITPLNFKLGAYCIGTKLFSNLPSTIKSLYDTKVFKPELKQCLFSYTSCSVGELTANECLLSCMSTCIKYSLD